MNEIDETLGLGDMIESEGVELVEHKEGTLRDEIEEYSDSDFKKSRQTLHDLVDKGEEAMDALLDLAKQSQDSKDFEALAKLMKAVVDANRDLASISNNKKRDMGLGAEQKAVPATNKVTNNYVGTTKDLEKLLENDK